MSTQQPAPIQTPGADRPIEPAPAAPEPTTTQPATRPPPPPTEAPAPATPFAPRGRAPRRNIPTAAPGLSNLLSMVAYAPWSAPEILSNNSFVPNANALFVALHFCDTAMLSTDRFTRGHPQWLPLVSRVYIAILVYLRVLDCMVLSGEANASQITLLNQLKSRHDFRALSIPGPLVPFFQAISVCNSGEELLGDITPVLPNFEYTSAQHYFTLLSTQMPNVPALIDQLMTLSAQSTFPNDPEVLPHIVTNLYETAIADDSPPAAIYAASGPGFSTPQNVTSEDIKRFHFAHHRLQLPPRYSRGTKPVNTRLNLSQFLRFDPYPGETDRRQFRQWLEM